MRVFATGGTGFVGSHSVEAFVAAGHTVRLLARTPAKVEAVLPSPEGVEVFEGDATDADAVARAMDGCDAAFNCVSMVSLDPRHEAAVRHVNARSAEVVLGTAARLGLDPIVHVSSVSALLPPEPPDAVLTADSPVGSPPGAYMQSKADADRFARALDAPVTLTYPTMVVGPRDPTMGEGMAMIAAVLQGLVPALPPGGMELVDVRDVAAVHAAALTPGEGARRFIVNGTHRSARALVADLARLTGRRLPAAPIPTMVASVAARVAEAMPVRLPLALTTEALWVLTLDARSDDRETRRRLGVVPRPLDETLTDIVRWMAETGVITRRQAGRLAP